MKYQEIEIQKIEIPQDMVRESIDMDHVNELKESIEDIGLINPITVYERDGKYRLVAGFHRLHAYKELGREKIPCMVLNTEKERDVEIQITENISRKNLTPLEEALAYKRLIDEKKYSQERIAKMIGKTAQYVYLKLAILDYHPAVLEALQENKINEAQARELEKCKDEKRKMDFLEDAVERGVSCTTLREWVKIANEVKEIEENPSYTPENQEIKPPEYPKGVCFGCGEMHPYVFMHPVHFCNKCWEIVNKEKERGD